MKSLLIGVVKSITTYIAIGILVFIFFALKSMQLTYSTFSLTTPSGAVRETQFPFFSQSYEVGVYQLHGTAEVTSYTSSIVRIIPDDEILTLTINNIPVDLQQIPAEQRRDYTKGFVYDLKPYLRVGKNEFHISYLDNGGLMGIIMSSQPNPHFVSIMSLLGTLAVMLFFYNIIKRTSLSKSIQVLFIAALCIRIVYFMVTPPDVRGHDLGAHMAYVEHLATHWVPPPVEQAAGGAFFHPPLYYYTAAVVYKLSQFVVHENKYVIYRVLQVFSLAYDMGFILFGLLILERLLNTYRPQKNLPQENTETHSQETVTQTLSAQPQAAIEQSQELIEQSQKPQEPIDQSQEPVDQSQAFVEQSPQVTLETTETLTAESAVTGDENAISSVAEAAPALEAVSDQSAVYREMASDMASQENHFPSSEDSSLHSTTDRLPPSAETHHSDIQQETQTPKNPWLSLAYWCEAYKENGLFWLVGSLFIFWPVNVIHSVRIGNDTILYCLLTASLYYVYRWYQEDKKRDLTIASILAALSIVAKANGEIMIAVIGIVGLYKMIKSREWKKYFKLAVVPCLVLLIAFTITVLPGLILKLQGKRNYLYFQDLSGVSTANLVGNTAANVLWFDAKTFVMEPFTDPYDDRYGRQYFWNYLGKTGIIGEFRYTGSLCINTTIICSFFAMWMMFYIIVGFYYMKKEDIKRQAPIILAGFFLWASVTYMRVTFPVNIDFRYILPALVSFCALYAASIKTFNDRGSVRLAGIGAAMAIAFTLSGIAFIFGIS